MLIKTLSLFNVFGFQNFTLELDQFTVLAGLNNAGKTSILKAIPFVLDCLRSTEFNSRTLQPGMPQNTGLLQHVATKYFKEAQPPSMFYRPSQKMEGAISLSLETSSGLLEFKLTFGAGSQWNLSCQGLNSDKQVEPAAAAKQIADELKAIRPEFIGSVGELPPEGTLDWNSLQQNISSGRNLETWRNQFHWSAETGEADALKRVIALVRQSLPAVRLNQPRRTRGQGTYVDVSYRESGFDYDISVGGAGLRTLAVLAAAVELTKATHLFLDEPDAHLHPGAQRDVAMFLAEQAVGERQIIVSTHAPDFIDAVPVDSLVWIDRNQQAGKRCDDSTRVLVDLGAIPKHDALQFSGADAVLYFEGQKDRRCFAGLMSKCGKGSLWQKCCVESLGGHGDGLHVSPAIRLMKNLLHRKLAVVVIRDADYLHLEPKIGVVEGEHVLDLRLPCKELENLFLTQETIEAAVGIAASRREEATGSSVARPSASQIAARIAEYTSSEELKTIVKRQWVFQKLTSNAGELKSPGQLKDAEDAFEAFWQNPNWRQRCCPGKEILRKLRGWLQHDYKLTLGDSVLLEAYRPSKELEEIFAQVEAYVTRMIA